MRSTTSQQSIQTFRYSSHAANHGPRAGASRWILPETEGLPIEFKWCTGGVKVDIEGGEFIYILFPTRDLKISPTHSTLTILVLFMVIFTQQASQAC
jgi:hypothetical protein